MAGDEPEAVVVAEPSTAPGRPPARTHRWARLAGVHGAGRLLRDFATYLPTQAIPAVVGFLALPVLARKLAPLDLGILTIAQTLISLGWTLSGQWLVVTIVRELPRFRARGDLAAFNRTLIRGLAATTVSAAGFAALLAIGSSVSSAVQANALLIIVATIGLVIQNVAVSLFAATLRPRAYAVTEVSARVGGIGLGIALVMTGHGVTGYIVGLACSSVAIGVVGILLAWPRDDTPADDVPADEPMTELRAWFRYGVPVSLGTTLLWGLAFVDRYILAFFRDAAGVGVYSMGASLGDRIVMVPMFAFTAAAAPLLVTAFETKGRAEVERLLQEYARVLLLVSLPCVAFVAAAGSQLVTLIAGYNYYVYAPAATVAPIVALGSVLYGLAGLATTGLAVGKRTRHAALSAAAGLAVNVAANLILIPPFGIVGAAIATPIGMAAYLVTADIWSRRDAAVKYPWGTLARAAAASAVAYAVVRLLPALPTREVAVSVDAGVGLAVYLASLVVLGERRRFAAS